MNQSTARHVGLLGFNLGIGVRKHLNPRWILKFGLDNNRAGSDPDELEFGVFRAGED